MDNLFTRILIAWDGGLEVARAIGQLWHLLEMADEVVVFTHPTGKALENAAASCAASLCSRGIAARALSRLELSAETGETLLQAARDGAASLIVMGAYAHTRLREVLFGGVTRHVLAHAPVPLLIAH